MTLHGTISLMFPHDTIPRYQGLSHKEWLDKVHFHIELQFEYPVYSFEFKYYHTLKNTWSIRYCSKILIFFHF